MENLDPKKIFQIRSSKIGIHQFDVETFLKYVLTQAKFTNPFNMVAMSDTCLQRLISQYFKINPTCKRIIIEVDVIDIWMTSNTNVTNLRVLLTRTMKEKQQRHATIEYLMDKIRLTVNRCLHLVDKCSDINNYKVFREICHKHIPDIVTHLNDLRNLSDLSNLFVLKIYRALIKQAAKYNDHRYGVLTDLFCPLFEEVPVAAHLQKRHREQKEAGVVRWS
jgi:hypothetical protein